MLGAIFIGLSGLSAYSKGLKTISNNVANLNTPGFKATSVRFTDAFTGASSGPRFVGSLGSAFAGGGVRYSQSSLNFATGELRDTGDDLDMAVNGRGMLVLLDGERTVYTRTASFKVDEEGYIVDEATGYKLAVLDETGKLTSVSLQSKMVRPAAATTKIEFQQNLSTSTTSATVDNITVFDSTGAKHVWKVEFAAVPGSTDWTVKVMEGATEVGTHTLQFLTNNQINPLTETASVALAATGGSPAMVTLDFSGILHGAGNNSIAAKTPDGSAASNLSSVKVKDGRFELTYANAKTADLGAVAVADFLNPQDLDQLGKGLYENRKGLSVRYLAIDDKTIGQAVGGTMEASNVDLSQEFGDLILVQRGYQASSQVVSVSNDMIQQLFGIRGQG